MRGAVVGELSTEVVQWLGVREMKRGREQPEREEERLKKVASIMPRQERREQSTVPDGAESLGKRRELIHWT